MIELLDVRKTYGSGSALVVALDRVSLRVDAGEFVAIMGASGSGKSTLLNLIGLLDRPTAGRYRFEGREVAELRADELARLRRERLGFVFQSFNLFPRRSALENAAMPLLYAGVGRADRRRRAAELLEQVGLSDRARHRPSELSGGQQQRVAIARALANRPAVILADEPTGNLDSRTGDEILGILRGLNDAGVTLLLITHEESVAGHATRMIRLHDGNVTDDRPNLERSPGPVSIPASAAS